MRTIRASLSFPDFIPWDVEIARLNFGANCGPSSLAAILGKEVCRVMCYFPHFEYSRWTNLTQMRRAFDEAGYSVKVRRCELPTHGVALIQWLGPWTKRDFFSRWSLIHTHWVAVSENYVFDHTECKWQTLEEWSGQVAPRFIENIPQAHGWAVKYGVETTKPSSSWSGLTSGSSRSSSRSEFSLVG